MPAYEPHALYSYIGFAIDEHVILISTVRCNVDFDRALSGPVFEKLDRSDPSAVSRTAKLVVVFWQLVDEVLHVIRDCCMIWDWLHMGLHHPRLTAHGRYPFP